MSPCSPTLYAVYSDQRNFGLLYNSPAAFHVPQQGEIENGIDRIT